jgi:hypothetical protein
VEAARANPSPSPNRNPNPNPNPNQVEAARAAGRTGEAADAVGDKWTEGSQLQTYPEAVRLGLG